MTMHPKNAQADFPDSRDWIYRPSLRHLSPRLNYPGNLHIMNQFSEGACTGFALAAAINLHNMRAGIKKPVSARMLYEMAKRHDEWEGEGYQGSSLRGAIHGWKHMGVCSEESWKYFVDPRKREDLTLARAQEAQNNTIGAYYRLRPEIADYHAALNETSVVVVSAKVHRGWDNPIEGKIQMDGEIQGGHAFALVGYNEKGFWVQNSWGKEWGDRGVALWIYEDWIANIMDGWVFRPALPTPQIFGMLPTNSLVLNGRKSKPAGAAGKPSIHREQIAGHFVHIDDGQFADRDRYWSTAFDVDETAKYIRDSADYDHVLFYGHGGLNSPKDSAARIAAMKDVFKANRVYPYHIMYDTGLAEELRDLILNKGNQSSERVGGVPEWLDRMTEHLLRRPGTLIWEEMKADAEDAFDRDGAGTETLKLFLTRLREAHHQKQIHLLGHSAGGILFAHLLKALWRRNFSIETCSLMAPACNIDLYEATYLPVLLGEKNLQINEFTVYNLRDELEQDDIVLSKVLYRKSLLYLVSNAFEREEEKPLLGMEKFKDEITFADDEPNILYSNGVSTTHSRSKSHGGFDNDPNTLNHVMRRILGQKPTRPFEKKDLDF